MQFEILETIWNGKKYKIEQDLPEVGAYLYCFENNVCVADYLQETVSECKMFALEEFGVPLERWEVSNIN